MKKIITFIALIFITINVFSQIRENGWVPMRSKVVFNDSIYFVKTPLINGVDTAATLRDVRAVGGGSIDMSLVRVEIGDSINALRPFIIYVADTSSMLAPYVRKVEVTAITDLKLDIADTTNMLSKYIRITDTLDMLDPYLLEIDAADTYAPLASPTFTGTVTLPTTTSIGDVSSTEIGYVNGVTSDVQTQIDALVPYSGATAAVDLGAENLTTTGSVTSGSLATEVLQVGDKDSYNVLNIDSLVRVGNTFQIFDGNTQLDPDFTDAGSTDLGIWAKMQADTVPIFVFGLGSGQSGDTAVFNDNAIAGAFWHNESDTLVVTSLMGVLAEGTGTETIAVQVSWGDNFKDGTPTNLNTSVYTITSITSGDEDTAFDNAEIPPNKWVWCTISGTSAGNRPSMLVLTLSGYYKNQSW